MPPRMFEPSPRRGSTSRRGRKAQGFGAGAVPGVAGAEGAGGVGREGAFGRRDGFCQAAGAGVAGAPVMGVAGVEVGATFVEPVGFGVRFMRMESSERTRAARKSGARPSNACVVPRTSAHPLMSSFQTAAHGIAARSHASARSRSVDRCTFCARPGKAVQLLRVCSFSRVPAARSASTCIAAPAG